MSTMSESNHPADIVGDPILKWTDPPQVRRNWNQKVLQVVSELQTRPGEWAQVEQNRKWHTAANVWSRYGCETAVRSNGVGGYDIFARWPVPATKYQAERERANREEVERARSTAVVNQKLGRRLP